MLCFLLTTAQPYLDIASTMFTYSPDRLQRWEGGLSLPLPIGQGNDKLVVSPFWEEWKANLSEHTAPDLPGRVDRLTGLVLPLTWVHELRNDHWKVVLTGIVRRHHINTFERGEFQYGGALIATYGRKPSLTWKVGVYANRDAFGLFVLPLLGLDWRIDAKHNVWGMLPGTFHYEHKIFKHFHWGIAFKAFTNSYGLRTGDFERMDENQLGAFGDLYMFKQIIAVRFEVGHTVLSQYQGGRLDDRYAALGEGNYVDHRKGDGPYVKMMVAFRVRLDTDQKIRNDILSDP